MCLIMLMVNRRYSVALYSYLFFVCRGRSEAMSESSGEQLYMDRALVVFSFSQVSGHHRTCRALSTNNR